MTHEQQKVPLWPSARRRLANTCSMLITTDVQWHAAHPANPPSSCAGAPPLKMFMILNHCCRQRRQRGATTTSCTSGSNSKAKWQRKRGEKRRCGSSPAIFFFHLDPTWLNFFQLIKSARLAAQPSPVCTLLPPWPRRSGSLPSSRPRRRASFRASRARRSSSTGPLPSSKRPSSHHEGGRLSSGFR